MQREEAKKMRCYSIERPRIKVTFMEVTFIEARKGLKIYDFLQLFLF
jgi:hypothetical protein